MLLAWLLVLPWLPAGGLTEGLSPALYRQLSEIREQMSQGEHRASLPRLQALLRGTGANPYSRAVLHQHLGYCHLELGDMAGADREFTEALELGALPAAVNHDLHLLLVQTALDLGRPDQALAQLRLWLPDSPEPTPEQRVLAARVYLAAQQPGPAIVQMEQAIASRQPPPEDWQRYLLGIYLDNDRLTDAAALLQRLIRTYTSKAEYWRHLAALEMRRGRDGRALDVMAAAHAQDLLEIEELTGFAQLYAARGIPEKAARLLAAWRESGRLGTTLQRLRAEANLWLMARERGRALAVLELAARRSDDGGDDLRRGRILFDMQDWAASREALERALDKGGIEAAQQVRLMAGVAALESGASAAAREHLSAAAENTETRAQARAWLAALEAPADGSRP